MRSIKERYTSPTGEGWLYLAVILDLFTRKVVGWAMRDHMRAELRPRQSVAAADYRDILHNVPMESFFGTLKTELVRQRE